MLYVWLYWAISVILTMTGIDIIEVYPEDSGGEFIGYLFVGFGLLAMQQCGKAMRR